VNPGPEPNQMNGRLRAPWAAGRIAVACLVAGGAATPAPAGDDFQSWHSVSLRWLDTPAVRLTSAAHIRLVDDSSDFALWRIGQAAATELRPWLRAGLAYHYTEAKNADGEWRYQHRGEIQLTPRWRIGEGITLSLRNRLELRANQGVSDLNERTRHRVQLTVATPGWRPLRGVYASDEVFYDFDRRELSENRLVPLGLNVRLGEATDWRVFYLLRSTRGAEDWTHAHILGTSLGFRL
jgi:hypothetical protein